MEEQDSIIGNCDIGSVSEKIEMKNKKWDFVSAALLYCQFSF